MPMLANARHERFAWLRAKGLPASTAYEKAGYKPNDGNASLLNGNQNIQERIEEHLDMQAQAACIDRAWVLVTLKRTIERCLQAEPVLDKEGCETGTYMFQAGPAINGLKALEEMLPTAKPTDEHGEVVANSGLRLIDTASAKSEAEQRATQIRKTG